MTSRPPPEALNPQKGNIMSIIRHEIRKISDENRGQPIISQAVVHGNVAYFAGITPNPIVGDIKTQCDASMSFSTSREPTNHSY